ncbi:MAG: orotate phosphoribosyltransferase [Gaiellaceae bacterium]
MTDAELARRIREHAYLEGDFVLRSGKRSRYYLDKYRFETRPELLAALGERLAGRARAAAPDAVRIAGPELGAIALAASASLASGLPFLIVRKAAKDYGTERLLEGEFAAGEEVCLVEDVVTSGGAAAAAVDALRAAGLDCRVAICVVDREEGGADALARKAVRLHALFRAREVLEA